jgi:hypothetical protein
VSRSPPAVPGLAVKVRGEFVILSGEMFCSVVRLRRGLTGQELEGSEEEVRSFACVLRCWYSDEISRDPCRTIKASVSHLLCVT